MTTAFRVFLANMAVESYFGGVFPAAVVNGAADAFPKCFLGFLYLVDPFDAGKLVTQQLEALPSLLELALEAAAQSTHFACQVIYLRNYVKGFLEGLQLT